MTLREIGQALVDFWNGYVTEITTQNILDWSIGSLAITFVGGFFLTIIGMTIVGGGFALVYIWVEGLYKKTPIPAALERMDQKFGSFGAGLIYVGGTFVLVFGLIVAAEVFG